MNCQCQVFILRGGKQARRRRNKRKKCASPSFCGARPGPTNREPNSTTLVQTPTCCDAPLTNMGLRTLKNSRLLKSREEMMALTPGDTPHTNTKYEQYYTPF